MPRGAQLIGDDAAAGREDGELPPEPRSARLLVINTHLLFNPKRGAQSPLSAAPPRRAARRPRETSAARSHPAGDIKIGQIRMIAREAARFRGEVAGVAWAGDFNLTPGSAIYELLVRGRLTALFERDRKSLSGQLQGPPAPGAPRAAAERSDPLRLGWDATHGGGIVYMMDVLGRPLKYVGKVVQALPTACWMRRLLLGPARVQEKAH